VEDSGKEQLALFKFGLISPILNGQVDVKDYLAKIAAQKHEVPGYGVKEYAPKTIRQWVLNYRREGFNGLKPKNRKDQGVSRKLSREEEEHVLSLRQEMRLAAVTVFYDHLVGKGEILPADVSYSTIYRLLKKNGMAGRALLATPERKRFAHDTINVVWQGDLSYGPYLKVEGRKHRTFLLAFIDDCSRVVTGAGFHLSEGTDSLREVFSDAVLRRGIPRVVYVDNGKIYRSEVFQIACATLGITLAHTQPYDAPAKGKIERFFKTVRTRFYPLLGADAPSSLEDLNQRFWRWLEEDYHRKRHSSLNMTPLELWVSQAEKIRMLEDPAILKALFRKRDKRKVRHDATISVQTKLYEVSPRFIGKQVEIRYDDKGVFIYEDGLEVEQAEPVDFTVNAHAKRKLSLKEIQENLQDV